MEAYGEPCPKAFWVALATMDAQCPGHGDTLTLDGMPARWVVIGERVEVVALERHEESTKGAPQPKVDSSGVPWCTEVCMHHDGDSGRCAIRSEGSSYILGSRLSSICEPAVRVMALVRVQGYADG